MANAARKVWAVLIFGGPGLGFAVVLAVGLYFVGRAAITTATHTATRARVVELRSKGTTRGASGYRITVHCPTLEFSLADGTTHRFEQDEAVCDTYAVGDEVSILYDPDDPDDAWIASFMSQWLAGIVMTVLGGGLSFACFLLMRRLGWRPSASRASPDAK